MPFRKVKCCTSCTNALWRLLWVHYDDVIVGTMASQITSLTIIYSTVYSGTYQRKHQNSPSPAFVRGIHRWPVNSSHKWPVTRKMFPFDDVIMYLYKNKRDILRVHCVSADIARLVLDKCREEGENGQLIYWVEFVNDTEMEWYNNQGECYVWLSSFAGWSHWVKIHMGWPLWSSKFGLVTMIVPASGHQVRCIPWVQMGTFNKEIGFYVD